MENLTSTETTRKALLARDAQPVRRRGVRDARELKLMANQARRDGRPDEEVRALLKASRQRLRAGLEQVAALESCGSKAIKAQLEGRHTTAAAYRRGARRFREALRPAHTAVRSSSTAARGRCLGVPRQRGARRARRVRVARLSRAGPTVPDPGPEAPSRSEVTQ